MEISQSVYGLITICSVIIGFILGVIYDIFRIRRITMESENIIKNIIIFAEDIIFAVISAVIMVLMIYHLNNGRIRWFFIFGAGIGFIVYYNTIGRIVIICSEKIIKFIRYCIRMIKRFIYKFFIRPVVMSIYNRYIKIYNKLYTKKYISKMFKQVSEGFNMV